jgi:threonine/homoserine/homoserine lactone efflux protein
MPPAPALPAQPVLAADALLGMLFPFWQLVIAAFVVFVVVASARRLARRGPSRMTTALLVTGAAIIGLAVLSVLFQG